MDRYECGLVELKLAGSGTSDMTFSGYGAVFGNRDSHGDVIQKGAFAETIAEAKSSGIWPSMHLEHGPMTGLLIEEQMPIGVYTDIREDDNGLYVEGKIAPTRRGIEAHALMSMTPRPALSGLSIGYVADPRGIVRGDGKSAPKRILSKLHLVEISLVTAPSNTKARVSGVKSMDEIETLADCERVLREHYSKAEATALVSRIKRLCRSDSGMDNRSDSGLAEVLAALQHRGTQLPK